MWYSKNVKILTWEANAVSKTTDSSIFIHYAVIWIAVEMNKQEKQTMKSPIYKFKIKKKEERESETALESERTKEQESRT